MRSKCKLFLDSDDDENIGSGSMMSPIITSETHLLPLSAKRKRKLRELSEYSSDEDEPISLLLERDSKIIENADSKSIHDLPQEISNMQYQQHIEPDIDNHVLAEKYAVDGLRPLRHSKPTYTAKGSTFQSTTTTLCSNGDDSYLPNFSLDFTQPDYSLALHAIWSINKSQGLSMRAEVNRYAARYLFDHQVEGVKWLWEKYCQQKGAILGDDMGMGKTIQVAAFLLALFQKDGNIDDAARCRLRRCHGHTLVNKQQLEQQQLDFDRVAEATTTSNPLGTPDLARLPICLIACPASVLENWRNELLKWGYFLVDTIGSTKSDNSDGDCAISRAKQGQLEVLLTSYDRLTSNIAELSQIEWTVIVLDEAHQLKNSKTKSYQAVSKLSKSSWRLGLTGTPIQNRLEELWALLYLINNSRFMGWAQFREDFDIPIKRGLSSKACTAAIDTGKRRSVALNKLLTSHMLQRGKELLAGDKGLLKGKNDFVVLCDLSELQKTLYRSVLQLPDFDNVRHYADPCPCGKVPRTATHSSDVQFGALTRATCCEQYRIPVLRDTTQHSACSGSPTKAPGSRIQSPLIDSRAVVWRTNHPDDTPCHKCPTCILLPCLTKLIQVASHPGLLQETSDDRAAMTKVMCSPVKQTKHNATDSGDGEVSEAMVTKSMYFLREAIDPSLVASIGGVVQSQRFQDACRPDISGKMLVLQRMLQFFTTRGEKVLVFSYSTRAMDIIETFIRGSGWIFRRLDGATPVNKRQKLVDEFNSRSMSVQIFLSSSKAGGLGLNLASASKVIIFDVHWNPSVDLQSQDRAYRIGQTENVSVFRLVAKGTVEEIIYMRQLYKQELKKVVLQREERSHDSKIPVQFEFNRQISYADHNSRHPRNFEGVEGDSECRGELFGIQNLMQFSETSILEALRCKFEEATDSNDDEDNVNLLVEEQVESVANFDYGNCVSHGQMLELDDIDPGIETACVGESSSTPRTAGSNTSNVDPNSNSLVQDRLLTSSRRRLSLQDIFRDALPSKAALEYIRKAIDNNDLQLLDTPQIPTSAK